ncbi:MAG TPA: hypothetical protein VEP90_24185 [Methylomirabilota bacterium]|nr:hypothetical protein [Methylomirabilota bacterium]
MPQEWVQGFVRLPDDEPDDVKNMLAFFENSKYRYVDPEPEQAVWTDWHMYSIGDK